MNNEVRVLHAYTTDFPLPERIPWITEVCHSNEKEESRGIDLIFLTDVGRILLQLKSSRHEARRFRDNQQEGRYSTKILVAVITARHTPRQIRETVTPILAAERNRRLKLNRRYDNEHQQNGA